jgi:hypothetical protein
VRRDVGARVIGSGTDDAVEGDVRALVHLSVCL